MRHEIVLKPNATRTIASFSSAWTGGVEPRFQWRKTLSAMPVNEIYLLDEERSWWHFCFDAVLEVFKQHRPDLLIGASMGGYGALLFGGVLGIPARAYSPQTMLSEVPWDKRYEEYLPHVRRETKHPELLDLTVSGKEHCVHYCERQEQDKRHAQRLDVTLIPHDCDHHTSASAEPMRLQ
jgi:hypothetical protein